MKPRTRLFVLAALTSLVPLGAGVYSLDPAVPEVSPHRQPSGTLLGAGAVPGPAQDALVPRPLPAHGDLFGGLWTPGSRPWESSLLNDAAAPAGGSATPRSAPDSVDRVRGDAMGAVPRKSAEPDRWEALEA